MTISIQFFLYPIADHSNYTFGKGGLNTSFEDRMLSDRAPYLDI